MIKLICVKIYAYNVDVLRAIEQSRCWGMIIGGRHNLVATERASTPARTHWTSH